MDIHEHLRFVARTIKDHAVYSQAKDAWVISVPHLRAVLDQQPGNLPPELPTLDDVLEEGVCRDMWEMDFDHDSQMDILVIR